MTAKSAGIKERGAPVWVSAPVRRKLEELRVKRVGELARMVTMSEIIEQLLRQAEGMELLAAHTTLAGRKPDQP